MKYKIVAFKAPHVVVEYSTDDGTHKAYLNVRIDKKPDGTLPQGAELDAHILSYAPLLGQPDPYAGVDWSGITALVQAPTLTQAQLNEQQAAAIKGRLAEIDLESIRSLRAKGLPGKSKAADDEKLSALEAEAETLRAQLAAMGG
jgi:hypothetical protein